MASVRAEFASLCASLCCAVTGPTGAASKATESAARATLLRKLSKSPFPPEGQIFTIPPTRIAHPEGDTCTTDFDRKAEPRLFESQFNEGSFAAARTRYAFGVTRLSALYLQSGWIGGNAFLLRLRDAEQGDVER